MSLHIKKLTNMSLNQSSRPKDHILVIFGATGDLTKRKLMPALFELEALKMLPEKFLILGIGRSSISVSDFREHNRTVLKNAYNRAKDQTYIKRFLERLFYLQADTQGEEAYMALNEKLQLLREQSSMQNFNLIFYLSTPPSLYEIIPRLLAKATLNEESEG